ncbi:MAG: hypothetical protein ACRDVE_11700 [Actinocrinis sp.]
MSNIKRTPVEEDWRFAELVARVWMEPGLADRYAADPRAVLAEFGLVPASHGDAPDLARYCGPDLIIEDVEHARGYRLTGTACFCVAGGEDKPQPQPQPQPEGKPAPVRER